MKRPDALSLRILHHEKEACPDVTSAPIHHNNKKSSQPTADADPKQHPNHKVPPSHGDHDAHDGDVLRSAFVQPRAINITSTPVAHLLTRCLVSHNASLTRSMPNTKINEPTTMTATRKKKSTTNQKNSSTPKRLTQIRNRSSADIQQQHGRQRQQEPSDARTSPDAIEPIFQFDPSSDE